MGYYSISGALQIDLCCLLKPSSKCILQSAQLTLLPRLIGYILVSLWCDKVPIPQQILKLMTAGVKFLVLLNCYLLLLTTSFGIPNLANIFFKLLMTQVTVFWQSTSISKYFE